MMALRRMLVGALTLGLAACKAEEIPVGPGSVEVPGRVSVTVEYRQLNSCQNVQASCEGDVVFYGSWMRQGDGIALANQTGSYVWTGTIAGVPINFPPAWMPVNYPPYEEPYYVRIYDPYLRDTPTAGRTGRRLKVGTQALSVFGDADMPTECAWVYVDASGIGHNPF